MIKETFRTRFLDTSNAQSLIEQELQRRCEVELLNVSHSSVLVERQSEPTATISRPASQVQLAPPTEEVV